MEKEFHSKIVDTADPDFLYLVTLLDRELDKSCQQAHQLCEQYNQLDAILVVVLIYQEKIPVACGAFKQFDSNTVEIKRVFVKEEYRGLGLSKLLLAELERIGKEEGYSFAVLETGKHLHSARGLYAHRNYRVIPNYGPYRQIESSICMKKELI
ncbi:acetyltransferase [Sphaerochaeta pleomorpha str. Grapes]|uniref:Acetyltransferase n=1 Tax=Sphaerochaeta pleomorpha (strain ATCC BAA-1885 / DSM 22778 / Grapes) TaxID=158190 RepID=G8QSD7_SPHPG|nr:GNAT family N-acetyltransferase [Sphaerochaeta pleomorpha]AEV30067.1 acetyltransferase [Sphaerochaeta pleomorpha str. Grapes]